MRTFIVGALIAFGAEFVGNEWPHRVDPTILFGLIMFGTGWIMASVLYPSLDPAKREPRP